MPSIMPLDHSLSPTRIKAPPQAISILCQMELHLFMSPTYGFLAGAILAKGCRPDFNNGLKGDSNSGLILALGVYSSLVSNNSPSPGRLNLVSDGATSVHVSYLWFPGSCHIWPRAAGLTSIMASEVTEIVAPSAFI